MPIGEHLLRLVEQIELVASSTSDLLLAFRVNLTTEAMEGEEAMSIFVETGITGCFSI